MRKPPAETPRWKKTRKPQKPAPVIQIRGRKASAQLAATLAPPVEGDTPQDRLRLRIARRSGAFRFRNQIHPWAWLGFLLCCGLLHLAPHPAAWGAAAGTAVPAVMLLVAAQRRREPPKARIFTRWVRRYVDWEAAATAVLVPVIAAWGLTAHLGLLLLAWAPFGGMWVRHFRWRAPAIPDHSVIPVEKDRATWMALCDAQKWNATLGKAGSLPGGGRSYPIRCDGIKTVMNAINGKPDNVAGAWHLPGTQVYTERARTGIPSRGKLTILPGNSLQDGRAWDGNGMDPATGLARVGRYADGADAHIKMYKRRYGCRHMLVCGTTGSGKTAMLDLIIFIALTTGWFVPVILDPQGGQSLPFWQKLCIYAAGTSQVEKRLRGLHAAFEDRSERLATWAYSEDGIDYPGMGFFDRELTGLPVPLVILDEAHLVLKDDSVYQRQTTQDVDDMAKVIRKAGGMMVLANQIPGLDQMGHKQSLRDMLRGGGVWSGRTANSVSGGMLGLVKDPEQIPPFFPDGSETAGLSYLAGPDNRPDAPMRTDLPGKDAYRNPPPVPALDDRFLEVMDRAMRDAVSPTATVAPLPGPASGGLGNLFAVPDPPRDGKPQLRCVDAVAQVLAAGGEFTRVDVVQAAGTLARAAGRDPWTVRQVGNVLGELVDGKHQDLTALAGVAVTRPREGVYEAVKETQDA